MNKLDIRPLPATAGVPMDWSAVSEAVSDSRLTERTPPEPGSLEVSLLVAGHGAAFINLRQSPAARFTLGGLERTRSHDLVWAELYDGILFQAEMR